MIKIFKKNRYHWQPELSWFLIYWSIAVMPIFIAMSLLLEELRVPRHFFVLFTLFIVLVGVGFHRYFIIEDDGFLRIVSLSFFKPSKIAVANISKVEVTKSTLTLVLTNGKRYLFYMRKWPKKYFLDALVLVPSFQGEVVLVDHLINLDYFESYQRNKKALKTD